jgi:hypothetical protein
MGGQFVVPSAGSVSVKKFTDETYLIVLPNLTDEVTERLVNIDALFCRSLDEPATEELCKIAALCATGYIHLPVI